MKYEVVFTEKAKKQLKHMDRSVSKCIMAWIRKNLVGCEDPRCHGRGLTANRSGQWRYRVGNYRIIADIQDCAVLILALEVGHRKEIYDL